MPTRIETEVTVGQARRQMSKNQKHMHQEERP